MFKLIRDFWPITQAIGAVGLCVVLGFLIAFSPLLLMWAWLRYF